MPAQWTAETNEFLMNNWGVLSFHVLMKKLNRSENSIRIKAQRLGLGAFLDAGEYITIRQLFIAIGRGENYKYTLDSWEKKGFPLKKKKVNNCSFKVVYLNDFWKWAKEYRMHINFSKFEENSLGKEPMWVSEQRKADIEFAKYKVDPWTLEEDNLLKSLLKKYRYTYKEISLRLLRSEAAIKRRMDDLALNTWPIREHLHGTWTEEQINTVIEMYNKGYRSAVIKMYIDKSEQAVNGKIERLIKKGILVKRK